MGREKILIDTTVLIDHLRKKDKQSTIFFKVAEKNDCCISTITEFEFSIGINITNRIFIESLLKNLLVLPFDSACVATAAIIFGELKSRNQILPVSDIFIASTAIRNDMVLATLNRKHFSRIKGLKLFP